MESDVAPTESSTAHFPSKLRFLFKPSRYKVVYGGRGGAKSWGIARALLLLSLSKKMRILCAREFQNSIEDSVHKLLSAQIKELGLEDRFTIQNATIIAENQSEFIFKGLKHNISSIKSFEDVQICWIEEAQTVSKTSWDVLIPTIRSEGSEIWISFNPSLETDATYERFVMNPPASAFVQKIGWKDNKWFPEVLRQEMEDLRARDFDSYLNVWEGHCRVTLDGAVYAKEIRKATEEGRITKVPYDQTVGVQTFWDLGFSDATAIFFVQRIGFEYHFIDFMEFRQTTINSIIQALQTKGYTYDTDFLPHDAQAKTLAANGKSIEQLLRAQGRKVRIVPKLSLVDGINAARTLFGRFYFDEAKCSEGIQRLRHYRFDVDEDTGTFSKIPLHDENSHAADALRYMAVGVKNTNLSGTVLNIGVPPSARTADRYNTPPTEQGLGWLGN